MEGFLTIIIIAYIAINIVSCIMYSCSSEDFSDFIWWNCLLSLIGFPGLMLGLIGRKIVEENKTTQWEAEQTRQKEEEKRRREREQVIKDEKDKKIQKQLEEKAAKIEQSVMFEKLMSFIKDTETPYQIVVESERVTVYLNGRTKTFDFLLNGIENIITPLFDKDSRETDLYALAFAIEKNMTQHFELTPYTTVGKVGDEYYQTTIKVTLKRKLQTLF